MPSATDDRMDEAIAAITGAGGAVATTAGAAGHVMAADLPATLPAFFEKFCALNAAAEAVVWGAERLTYADLAHWSDRAARALAACGVERGDRVALAMRNAAAWIVLHMGIVKAGGVATLVNGWWQESELAHGIALTTPVLVLADAERARRCDAAGIAPAVMTFDLDRPIAEALAPLLARGAAPLPEVGPDDDATILFTSGSTGRAKGAVSTHAQVTTGIYTYVTYTAALYALFGGAMASPPPVPAALVAVPLFHVTGEVPLLLVSFVTARKLVIMRKWDAGEALRLIEAERITYFIGVPTMSLELMQHPDRASRDLSSLMDIAAGGAARPVAHVTRLAEAFPAGNPMMGYGLTETNAVGCTNYRDSYLARPASCGRGHAPWVALGIFDVAGAPLPQGEVGEIGILSRANIRGYWDDPFATEKAFARAGHFLTGDLGYLDADGYLFIVDRAKDIVIRGGENISCLEVEAALYAHPAVAEASVFGLADERLGEVPAAAIHLQPGATLDAAEVAAFLEPRLAKFKRPERLWIEPAPLPKLGTGKIDKVTLRGVYAGRVGEVVG